MVGESKPVAVDEAHVLRLTEVLSADVSGTMLQDAVRSSPHLGELVWALGCVHAGTVALEAFRASVETEEQELQFARLVELVRERAKRTVQIASLNETAKGEAGRD